MYVFFNSSGIRKNYKIYMIHVKQKMIKFKFYMTRLKKNVILEIEE